MERSVIPGAKLYPTSEMKLLVSVVRKSAKSVGPLRFSTRSKNGCDTEVTAGRSSTREIVNSALSPRLHFGTHCGRERSAVFRTRPPGRSSFERAPSYTLIVDFYWAQ